MKKLILITITALLFLSGCKSIVYVPTVTVKDSIVYVNKIQRDSIYSYFHDSIYIHQKGDTVFVNKWHETIKYKDVIRIDTVSNKFYINKEKTVTINVLTKFQKVMMWLGGILSVLLIIFIVLKIRGIVK